MLLASTRIVVQRKERLVGKNAKSLVPVVSQCRIVLRWVLAGAMAAFIFFISSRTAGQLGTGLFSQIKVAFNTILATTFGIQGDPASVVAHFCEYLVLGLLLANALRSHMPVARALWLAIVFASLYGLTDEFHQLFVPGRYCDALDWVTDTCGAALGAGIFAVANRQR